MALIDGYSERALTESQLRLRDEVRAFADEVVRPSAESRSADCRWDQALWEQLGRRLWPGVVIPQQFGGLGMGAKEHAIIVEELSRVDASLGAAQNLLQQTVMAILAFGTRAQKERYLPDLAEGRKYSITGITEASAGSKLSDMRTQATLSEKGWTLTGSKTETHIADVASVALVFAKTGSGISAFLVDTRSEGFRVGPKRETIGLRALPMYVIHLDECIVPPESLLGGESGAMRVFFKSFDLTRVGNAAKCIGIAEGAMADALVYAGERHVGDMVVTGFQGIRWQVVDLAAGLAAARLMMYDAADLYASSGRATTEAAAAKLLASSLAMDATIRAVQITGSHGCFSDQPFGRYMQDAKVSQLTGGSVEILRNTIAKAILGAT